MSLANLYLKNGIILPADMEARHAKYAIVSHGMLLNALAPPCEANLDFQAERFIFDCDPPTLVKELVDAKQIDFSVVVAAARVPHYNTWIEWAHIDDGTQSQYRIGCLVTSGTTISDNEGQKFKSPVANADHLILTFAMQTHRREAVIFGSCLTPMMPWEIKKTKGDLLWWTAASTAGGPKSMAMFAYDAVACLFLMSIPRAVEYRSASGIARIPNDAKGKSGEVRYNRVIVHVKSPVIRYEPATPSTHVAELTGAVTSSKRGLHRVSQHFRAFHVGKGRTNTRVMMIEELWRGDPKYGIILTEKVIRE